MACMKQMCLGTWGCSNKKSSDGGRSGRIASKIACMSVHIGSHCMVRTDGLKKARFIKARKSRVCSIDLEI